MNKEITKVFYEILSSEELLPEFMLIDDVDEMYEFCLNIRKGYSKAEFEDFLMQLADECLLCTQGLGKKALSDEEISQVAGGVSAFKKIVSSGLAAATVLTCGGVNAADLNKKSGENYINLVPVSHENDVPSTSEIPKEKEDSFSSKIKRRFQKIGEFLWDNKGKVALGAAAVTAIILLAIGVKRYSKNKNNPEAEKSVLNTSDISKNMEKFISGVPIVSNVVSTAVVGFAGLSWIVDRLGNFAGNLNKIQNFFGDSFKIWKTMKDNGAALNDWLIGADQHFVYTEEERREMFEDGMKHVKGQEEAVKKVSEFFEGVMSYRRDLDRGILNTNLKLPKIIVLNGSAGTGKTMTAQILARALAPDPKNIYHISAEQINCGENSNPVKELFGVEKTKFFYYDSPKDNLGKFVMENPKGVAIIDEYDKIGNIAEIKGGRVQHPLDASLRILFDKGGMFPNPCQDGDPIDFSTFTLILTTNETNESLGLPKDEGEDKDPTRTHPLHDGSVLTRLKENAVKFQVLDREAYKKIAEDEIKATLKPSMTEKGGNCWYSIKDDTKDKTGEVIVPGVFSKMADYIMEEKKIADASRDENSNIIAPCARTMVNLCRELWMQTRTIYTNKEEILVRRFLKDKDVKKAGLDTFEKVRDAMPAGEVKFTIDFNFKKNENGTLKKGFDVDVDYNKFAEKNYDKLKAELIMNKDRKNKK